MTERIVGTCSLCGGPVSVPAIWMGIYPPVPTCRDCGAHAATHGPVIPMVERIPPAVPPQVTIRWKTTCG